MPYDNIFTQVERNIDALAASCVDWSIPVTHEEIIAIKAGTRPTRFFLPPSQWMPESMAGLRVLCLAGAGGQQAPLFASAGAEVTVLDLSENMLERDRQVALREGLTIRTEHGSMCDMSRFGDCSFDLIINPPSLMYVPDVVAVFCECHRVLKSGGTFIMTAPNPISFVCDYDAQRDEYIARNKLPYISSEHEDQGDWIEYGHTLESYIGGQIQCGFVITGFVEDRAGEPCDTSFTTRAVKG
ncbi:MAG: class I SAM-dependent methyltransferase [Eubacteriales bacterium]